MQELKNLAEFAAKHKIRGSSFKRNSLLKPLDIILQELDRYPNPKDQYEAENELALIRAGTKGLIFEHLERIAKLGYKPGRTKEGQVNDYVDLFFEQVLGKAHHNRVNKVLGRDKLIKSAYLVFLRQAIAQNFAAKGQNLPENDEEIEIEES